MISRTLPLCNMQIKKKVDTQIATQKDLKPIYISNNNSTFEHLMHYCNTVVLQWEQGKIKNFSFNQFTLLPFLYKRTFHMCFTNLGLVKSHCNYKCISYIQYFFKKEDCQKLFFSRIQRAFWIAIDLLYIQTTLCK